eukprot:GHVL01013503.1.p1 GENE.GHVL01013503.1~~GHVL01013503.1.p1  ORF type:complete len:140 (+),score=37.66 GHVL01013503.1:180-599(+)
MPPGGMKAWLGAFGLKTSMSKNGSVAQLNQISEYIFPDETVPSENEENEPAEKIITEDIPEKKEKVKKSEKETAEEVEEKLRDVIWRDQYLHEKILLFEPLKLNDIQEHLLTKWEISIKAPCLRRFLDSEGVIYSKATQ